MGDWRKTGGLDQKDTTRQFELGPQRPGQPPLSSSKAPKSASVEGNHSSNVLV